ncbi:RING-type domain-containing protein [Citrus sinensis]|nr:RING-type domain-containing protein [Citrus sinensis]
MEAILTYIPVALSQFPVDREFLQYFLMQPGQDVEWLRFVTEGLISCPAGQREPRLSELLMSFYADGAQSRFYWDVLQSDAFRIVWERQQTELAPRLEGLAQFQEYLERGLHGVEPVVVANFPMKKFSDEYFAAAEDTQRFNVVNLVGKKESSSFRYSIADPRCAVCLAEYHGEDTLRILPYCGHSFHATCIDIWLHQHSTCPVCRVSLRELPERKRLMQPMFSSAIRSHYGIESFDTHSYNYLSGHGFSSRTVGNRGMDSVPEDHCASDDDITDSGGNISPTTEGNQTTKDLGNKHVESPSNP